jgi:hypothetical protein
MRACSLLVASSCGWLAAAFTSLSYSNIRQQSADASQRLRLSSPKGPNENADPTLALTSALARLDQQWKIRQRDKPRSRWTQISLNNNMPSASDTVCLLEPPNLSLPSCVIVFVGGAGLGQYPQIAYNELLLRVSDKLNAAVIAAPYQVGLDHFQLAKKVGELSRKAMIHCEDDAQLMYPATLPTYCLCHSLGGKLMSIYLAATDQVFEGIGFMSFNNFGFAQTFGMAKGFAETIGGGASTGNDDSASFMNSPATKSILNQVFEFAATTVSAIGLDFTPTPAETERLIQLKFDADRQEKTRLFVFDDDNLDSSQEFVGACDGPGPSVSGLPGSHLTPVYFKFGLDELPEETRSMAKEATRGLESAFFGNEEELNALVHEVVAWIKGSMPSRSPKWTAERRTIAASDGS